MITNDMIKRYIHIRNRSNIFIYQIMPVKNIIANTDSMKRFIHSTYSLFYIINNFLQQRKFIFLIYLRISPNNKAVLGLIYCRFFYFEIYFLTSTLFIYFLIELRNTIICIHLIARRQCIINISSICHGLQFIGSFSVGNNNHTSICYSHSRHSSTRLVYYFTNHSHML